MKKSREKAKTKRKQQNTLAESSNILNFNKFASLYTDENTEDEDCNGSLDDAQTNFDRRGEQNKSKRPKKKNVKKKKKLSAMDIDTIKNSFDSKGQLKHLDVTFATNHNQY